MKILEERKFFRGVTRIFLISVSTMGSFLIITSLTDLLKAIKLRPNLVPILLLFLLCSIGCSNPVEQNLSDANLQLSFKNNSSHILQNLTVSNKYIGSLQSNSSSKYVAFENFGFDTGLPDEDASAEIDGELFTNYYRGYWCGTEKITVDSGKYLIEVEIIDTVLFLSCKNQPWIEYP